MAIYSFVLTINFKAKIKSHIFVVFKVLFKEIVIRAKNNVINVKYLSIIYQLNFLIPTVIWRIFFVFRQVRYNEGLLHFNVYLSFSIVKKSFNLNLFKINRSPRYIVQGRKEL